MIGGVVKRILLGMFQHLTAVGIALLLGTIVLNSHILVENMYGDRIEYAINPFDSAEQFEDSEIFGEMFRNAMSDIIRLSVIKGQLETEGEFDAHKHIDVTQFVNRKTVKSDCPVTAVFALDDLIKWGRFGTTREEIHFESREDFLEYFVRETPAPVQTDPGEGADLQTDFGEEPSKEPAAALAEFDRVVSEMGKAGKSVTVREQGDETIISVQMLICRYDTVDDKKLQELCTNWTDYSKLEANVIETIENIAYYYTQYQNRNEVYSEGHTNLRFLIKTKTAEGMQYYSNLPASQVRNDDMTQNEFFENMGRFVIYSPDSMRIRGNVGIGEDEMFESVTEYEYAFPESTQIWIGVDTDYAISTDSFAVASSTYNKIVPRIWLLLGAILLCALLWLALWAYLTITAGAEGETAGAMPNVFDKLATELYLLLIAAAVGGGFWGYFYIWDRVEFNFYYQQQSVQADRYLLGIIAAYGFALSFAFSLLWYSFVRRMQKKTFWSGSISCLVARGGGRLARLVLNNKRAALRTLLPYNIYLIFNLALTVFLLIWVRNQAVWILLAAALVITDTAVGVFLFRRSAERNEIVEGIAKIREGDVGYTLESGNFHGYNRTLAEAVNRMGEGMRNAVAISMKDERMKADLITNVSHDIKTPLTSIINYVDLLKRENISQQPAKGYIEVLDVKSQRLKQLTDDLVEASKISSGNIVLEMGQLNLAELIRQSVGEFSEKLEARGLQAIVSEEGNPANIYADSRRMWRVVENLFNNICKYAMEGTRVYIDIRCRGGRVEASVKNISETALNISPQELTERFIRGDSSRTTEGSGLGLSIARNLTELQGGEFSIYLDGDLFKAVLRFKEYIPPIRDLDAEGEAERPAFDAAEGERKGESAT